MERRRFIQQGVAGGALALGAGGFLFVRRGQAREAMTAGMLNDALPPLNVGAGKQLNSLPARGREEIKRFFHGKCLNVHGFVSHICSNNFVERLGRCRSQEEKEACFLQAFCSKVATEAEILNHVETIAAEVGSELDDEWTIYCGEVSSRWNARVSGYGSLLKADELTNRLGGLIRDEMGQAARQAASANRRPAVGETIGKIGDSAVRLLPLAVVSVAVAGPTVAVAANPLVIPVFFILAARHVWEYIMGRLDDPRGDYQAAISGRLALLGNRVGAEFEREVRERLTDLHTWQERSLRGTASRLAEERVGLI